MLVAGSRARVKSNPCLRFKLLTARFENEVCPRAELEVSSAALVVLFSRRTSDATSR